jgi:hypothetical protein
VSRLTLVPSILAITLSIFLTDRASAHGCQHCGCKEPCQKVCRLVCEEKKVEVTCWGCKVEEFCIPGPSKPGCKHCETVCDFSAGDNDQKAPCASPKKFVWTEWIPGCATIHTRKKLMKRTVIQTIPSYKWVVEDLCDKCESSLLPVEIGADSAVPPPPKVDAATKFLPARIAPLK